MTLTTPNVDTDVDTILQEAAEMPACAFDDCEERADGMIVLDCGHDLLICSAHYALLVEHIGNGFRLQHSARNHAEHTAEIVRWIAL